MKYIEISFWNIRETNSLRSASRQKQFHHAGNGHSNEHIFRCLTAYWLRVDFFDRKKEAPKDDDKEEVLCSD